MNMDSDSYKWIQSSRTLELKDFYKLTGKSLTGLTSDVWGDIQFYLKDGSVRVFDTLKLKDVLLKIRFETDPQTAGNGSSELNWNIE